MSISSSACHNVVDCLQVCTAQAASETDSMMQNVALLISSPFIHLFHVHRWFLSETAILTVHRLSAINCIRRGLLHMW